MDKIDVLDILLNLLREHEETLDSLIERMEIVDQTINQDPSLKKTLHEFDATKVEEIESQNILVVDDDKSLTSTFKLILEGVGYSVDTAVTGEQALSLIKQKEYDIVLLDLNLPDMLGDEVAEKIEKNSKQTDIIFITGYPMLKEHVESNQNNKKVLMKPIDPEELVEITTRKQVKPA